MIPIRLYIALAAILVLLGGGWWYGHTRYNAGEAAGNARALAAEQERDAIKKGLAATQEASRGYQQELDRLRNTPPSTRVVRLCPNNNLPVPGAPGPVDGPGSPGGVVPEEPRLDIGPRLYSEADRADRLAAQLRALQNWLNEVQR